jgi:hypothetical protein
MGWVGLLLALIVAGAIGSMLQDAVGVPYGLFGALVWAGILAAAFSFGVSYHAQYVLPPGERDSWFEGGRMIWRHYRLRGFLFLKQLDPSNDNKGEESPLPTSFKKLNAGMVPSHDALALARGNSYARPAGPGFVMLYRGESIKAIIDLRPHVRGLPVKTNTRDGIPIETRVTVVFQVRRYELDHENGQQPYNYDREAIFHVAYMQSIDNGDQPRLWTEQICPPAAAMLVDELGRHMLDDLYSVEGTPMLLPEIGRTIQQALQNQLAAQGVDLIGVGVGHLELPPQVREQRIRVWQMGWEQKIKVREGMGQAEVLRRVKQARARAQIEIITRILESIDAMRHLEDTNLSEIIMLRMIEVLEETAQDSTIRNLFPKQVVSKLVLGASSEMRQLLDGSQAGEEESQP